MGSPSTSLPESVIATAVSSLVATDCGLAVGVSLTGVTVIETVAGSLSTVPSFTLNVNESVPL